MTIYLVSGEADIAPSHENIRRTGRRVRYGSEVSDDPRAEMREGRFVVVAHGDAHGTIRWGRPDWEKPRRWLFVGMPDPPRDVRIYLYSCRAGRRLPRFLSKRCTAFGHVDVVPMPVDAAREIVLGFFREVDRLLAEAAPFDTERWKKELGAYVNGLYVAEVKRPTGLLDAALLLMLRSSLGFSD